MDDAIVLAVLAGLCFVIAGTVKGLAGLGLPTAAIGLMTMFIDPRSAIAITLLPMVALNGWQVWRSKKTMAALRRYAVFGVVLVVGVGFTSLLSGRLSNDGLMGLTGCAILIFVAVNFSLNLPRLPDHLDRSAQTIAGLAAGIIGGLTALWAPPLAIYLAARHVDKDEFVRASGLLILLGSLPLVAGYVAQGFLTAHLAAISGAMILPGLLGFSMGEALRARLSPQRFRKVLLLIFLGLGLNLIRRAWM